MAKRVIDFIWQSGELGAYRMLTQAYGDNTERIRTELARQGLSFTQGKLAAVKAEYDALTADGKVVTWR